MPTSSCSLLARNPGCQLLLSEGCEEMKHLEAQRRGKEEERCPRATKHIAIKVSVFWFTVAVCVKSLWISR